MGGTRGSFPLAASLARSKHDMVDDQRHLMRALHRSLPSYGMTLAPGNIAASVFLRSLWRTLVGRSIVLAGHELGCPPRSNVRNALPSIWRARPTPSVSCVCRYCLCTTHGQRSHRPCLTRCQRETPCAPLCYGHGRPRVLATRTFPLYCLVRFAEA